MAINLNGLNIIPQAATLTTGGGAPLGLNNEIRGGIHRISGLNEDDNPAGFSDLLTDIDGTLLQQGMLVYNEADSTHYQYVNSGTVPADPPNANDPYRNALGVLPNTADNWVAFEIAAGNSPLEGWTIDGSPLGNNRFLQWDPGRGLNEWRAGADYTVGDRFYTTTDSVKYPDVDTRNSIFTVDVAYRADSFLDANNVGNTITRDGPSDPTNLTWVEASNHRVPFWDPNELYNTGDVIAFRLPAIPNVFPVATTVFFEYNGTTGTNTGAPVDITSTHQTLYLVTG